ncbi:ABC transporter, ATP-binding/permease components [Arcobacter venerupis]|uniref:ABC transporter, ATP-binding/permease components n=1 Tax=Arcobacter venerupis TaxID=1054033 RepID=A0AAE7B8X7_9BACT|nr:ABC transporter ATP-binding protein [Arcobacter venerupis]QKF66060.1 ABC transporter, ATP-binding/permease components [Arcobacter venerupis]RWS51151.1 ABC transporter ATP-binding protein/permease [Arcobacter venerupis]
MKKYEKHKQGLWAIIAPVNGYIKTAISLSIIGGITSIIGFVLLAYVLLLSIKEKSDFFQFELSFNEAFLLLTFVVIISFLTRYYSFVISHLGAFKLEEILRTNITAHLAKIPLGYVITTGTGALKKVLLDDVKNLHAFVADSIPMIGKSITTPIASLFALLIINYVFALVALSVLLIGAVIMYFVMKDSVNHRKNYEQSQSDINKAVIEFIQAMMVVRTFDDGTSSFKRYNESLLRYRVHLKAWIAETSTPAKISMTILSPMPTLLAISLLGIFFVLNGTLDFVSFIAILLVSTGMADSLMPIMWMSNFIKKSSSSALRIQEIMDLPQLTYKKDKQLLKNLNIEFDNVSFKYENRLDYALQNISFKVKEKSVTALVGHSGAGKSTIAKLIPRFWDITSGSIKIGEVDIKDIDATTLMDTISFVFQDTFLFNDTLENNIKIANSNATREDMIEACKAAQIHDFILTLPKGYETLAGDRGTNLSGGQKQRITIARAILRNAPIVVLDEATAFADPENEEEIIKALANLMKNKTVIVIAHRLSTIKDVEQIIVFDDGKISEIGKHNELLENQGIYAKLWSDYEKSQNWHLHYKGDVK